MDNNILDREVVSATTKIEFEEESKNAEIEELNKRMLYLQADVENIRKQSAIKIRNAETKTKENLMRDMLPVLDDLERAENSLATTDNVEGVKEGVNLVFSKLYSILEANGLKPIITHGAKFNTNFHEAIVHVDSPSHENGDIVDCVQKGYVLNDKVIRYAKVAVAK